MSICLPDIDHCFGCGVCVDACHHKALRLTEDANGFYRPEVDAETCVNCGACTRICPALHDETLHRHDYHGAEVYAAWSENESLIKRSASGGVFAQVAHEFLLTSGRVVYGAMLTAESKVVHVGIEDVSDLWKLQNSKYQQSNVVGVYKEVKRSLGEGKEVLFSGTPCQVAALYSYLGKSSRDNLYTMEVICHGVPSNYLAELSLRLHGAKRIVSYRTKSRGWAHGNRTTYGMCGGSELEVDRYRKDFHSRSYLSFWLRKSCQSCPFAQENRVADVTMGDFWGNDKGRYNNYMGVSVMLVNSDRGRLLLSRTEGLVCKPTTWREVLKCNQNLYMPTIQGAKLSHHIASIKQLPIGVQKVIFQQGFTNKWLFGAGQVIERVCDKLFGGSSRRMINAKREKVLATCDIKKKKVGILTTYFAANFGAMLQPYALKRVLELRRFAVEFIRYKQKSVYESHRAASLQRLFGGGLRSAVGNMLALPFALVQDEKMQSFKRRYLEVDDKFDDSIPANKDYYLFGSDQIWNPRNTGGFDDVYFGNFAVKEGAKKIAYAASGECIEDTEYNRAYLQSRLLNFDAIGVREKSLCIKLEQMTGVKNMKVVLDPTLLAPRSVLDELPGRNVMGDAPYVFFYQLRQSVSFLSKIHAFARLKGCKLLVLSSSPKKDCMMYALRHSDVKYLPSAGMEAFLGGIRHAKYVFSPSFHGSVFAIVYNKPLYSISLNDGLDTRTRDLLGSLGMSHRIVRIDTDLESVEEVDYNDVNPRVEALREQSMDFLIQNMDSI